MKRYGILVLVALMFAATGIYAAQRFDLASTVDGQEGLAPRLRANVASTGTTVDIANYRSAMAIVHADSIDATAPNLYVVLQDSSTAWAAVDSVKIDSAMVTASGTGYKEISYRGAKRYIRVIQRASGNNADSVATSVMILRGGCRVQPC